MKADQHEPGILETKVPGRSRTRAAAMADFERLVAQARKYYKPVFWPLYVPRPDDAYRWRVALDCGCVIEEFTSGSDRFPDSVVHLHPLGRSALNPGERICDDAGHRNDAVRPYREIVTWVDHEVVVHPDDPEECPYEDWDPKTWAAFRRPAHSTAHWTVTLSCGHQGTAVSLDPDWRPPEPPRLTTVKRAREMSREMEEYWAENPDDSPQTVTEREHERRMLALRWPHPSPESDCYACKVVARITGYQRVGWLVSRSKPKQQPTPESSKEAMRKRLASLEAQAEKLRRELDESG